MSLPPAEIEEIQNFVSVVLKHWYGLQAALNNGMGGPPRESNAKVEEMINILTNLCCKTDINKDELADTLENLADSFFNTWFEDGSIDEVAYSLWNHTHKWHLGNKDTLRFYVTSKSNFNLPECPKLADSDSDNEPEKNRSPSNITKIVQNPSKNMETEEAGDGWEIPKHSHRKARP